MTREEFKKFVEQTLEQVIAYAEEKTGRSLQRDIAFQWMFRDETRIRHDIAEQITQRVFIDDEHIYPVVDIGVLDILQDGTPLVQAAVSGHSPRTFQKNWTGRDGPFVYMIGKKLLPDEKL